MRFHLALLLWTCCLSVICGSTYGLKVPTVKLSDGNELPIVGFGTHFRTPTQEEEALLSALDAGYTLFDTAYNYYNEETIGKTLKKWFDQGGKREDLFIATKLPSQGMRASDVELFLKLSLKNLGLDYIDLYLIHTPFGFKKDENFSISIFENGTYEIDPTTDHIAIWKEMENQVKAGRVRSIGLSNFNETQILNVYNHAEIKPSNLQVETNLYLQQSEIRKLCRELNIVVTAYSPLGSNDMIHLRRRSWRSLVGETLPPPIKHPLVQEIAGKYNKSPAQVLLRFSLQNGVIVIPKSGNPGRMRENLDLFDFELTREDMAQLETLDQHGKVRKFDFLSFIGVENHPEYPFTYRIK